MKNKLPEISKGITAFIGSGGKTTLIHRLAEELSVHSKVVFCTTTKIFPSDTIHTIKNPNIAQVKEALKKHNCLCIGNYDENTEKLSSPNFPIHELKDIADYILVEADGSKHLPIKAHESFEPVFPKFCDKVILVVGASGFNKAVRDAVHRKNVFCDIADCGEDDIVTPELVGKVINHENLSDIIFVNQVDDDSLLYIPTELEAITDKVIYYGRSTFGS